MASNLATSAVRCCVEDVCPNGDLVIRSGDQLYQKCRLVDFIPTACKWTSACLSDLKRLTAKPTKGKIHDEVEGVTFVTLYCNESTSKSVGVALIEASHGQPMLPSYPVRGGASLSAFVSFVTSPREFWIQEEGAVVDEISSHLISAYPDTTLVPSLSFEALYEGVSCVARYKEDGALYRASVISAKVTEVEVLYVDYGNVEIVQPEDLFPLPNILSSIPCQSVHCVLKEDTELEVDQQVNVKLASSAMKGRTLNGMKWAVSLEDASIGEEEVIYTRQQLTEGSEVVVIATHIDSPDSLWVQLSDTSRELEELMTQIAEMAPSIEETNLPPNAKMCLAVSSLDQGWYRGEVVAIDNQSKQVTVHFVDYGNQEDVTMETILPLPGEFAALPAQAIQVSLARVTPCDHQKGWGPKINNVLEQNCLEKEMTMKIITMATEDGIPVVELIDLSTNANVSDTLLKEADVHHHNQSQKSASIAPLNVPLNVPQDVLIAYSKSLDAFWLQLAERYAGLRALMDGMSAHYSTASKKPLPPDQVEIGKFCATQFSEDGMWYRAMVTMVTPTLRVQFVDFGNEELKSGPSELYHLTSQFTMLPSQAISCKLADFRQSASGCSVDKGLEDYLEQQLVANFVKKNSLEGCYTVQLFDTREGKEINIGKLLSNGGAMATVSPGDLPSGIATPAYVTEVVSPSEFYIQTEDSEGKLGQLMSHMNAFYLSSAGGGMSLNSQDVCVGMFCAGQFTVDDSWYRCTVKSLSQTKVEVLYIDYGNAEVTTLKRLRHLDARFCKPSSLAIKCSLSDGAVQFDPSATEKLSAIVMEKRLMVTPKSKLEGDTLFVSVTLDGEDILKKLCSVSEAVAMAIPKEALKGFQVPILREGSHIKVIISDWESHSSFSGQFSDSVDDLKDLSEKINAKYSSQSSIPNASAPSVGDAVCALYSEDECWYRGQILEKGQGSKCKVLFVDFGNKEWVEMIHIKKLLPQFHSLPLQSIQCSSTHPPATPLSIGDEISIVISKQSEAGGYMIDFASQSKKEEGACQMGPTFHSVFASLPLSGYLDVTVTHVKSPNQFYCQLCEAADKLSDMTARLSKRFQSSPPASQPLLKGQICAARYDVNNEWYRGLVREVKGQTAEVFFIDFGNHTFVPLSSVHPLPEEFQSLPAQAISSSLHQVEEPLEGWSDPVIADFTDLVNEEEFVAEVKEKFDAELKLSIDLLDDDKSIREIFIQKMEDIKSAEGAHSGGLALKTYPTRTIKCGHQFQGEVVYIDSPSLFQIRILDSEPESIHLWENIEQSSIPSNRTLEIFVSDLKRGAPCMAKYSLDGAWYRGIIEGQKEAATKWIVKFVDYGNTEVISSLADIKRLPPSLLAHPPLIASCQLHGIASSLGPASWSRQAVNVFKDVLLNKEVTVTVATHPKDGIHPVVVQLPGGLNIADSLCKAGYAVVANTELPLGDSASKEPSEDLYLSTTTSSVQDSASTHPSSHPSSDAEDINNTLVHQLAFVSLPLPAVGAEMEVFVSYATSPSNFYCQNVCHIQEMDTLFNSLHSYCSGTPKALPSPVVVGQPCAVLYEEDQNWYRAEVTELSGEKVTVQFVDYGNFATVLSSSLVALRPEHLSLPAQSLWCSITENFEKQFSQSENEKFVTMVTEKEFKLKVKAVEDASLVVSLFDGKLSDVGLTFLEPHASAKVVQKSSPKVAYKEATPPNPGDTINAFCTYVSSPGDFFCQSTEYSDALDDLMCRLAVHCSEDVGHQSSWAVGGACAALYSVDQSWYRAEVSAVNEDGTVTVQYVDYGNIETVPTSDLRNLKLEHVTLPPQSIWCSITSDFEEVFTSEVTESFKAQVLEKEFEMTILDVIDGSVVCQLRDDKGQLISTSATEVGLTVKSTASVPLKTDVTMATGTDLYFAYPEQYEVGMEIEKMQVTWINSPVDLFCQDISQVDDLDLLMAGLADYCNSTTALSHPPSVGSACAGKSALDGAWYRCEVIEILPNDAVKVSFVDYGNQEKVSLADLRPIKEDYVKLPACAVNCSLKEDFDCQFSAQEIEEFNTALEQIYTVRVTGSVEEYPVVQLYDQGELQFGNFSDASSLLAVIHPTKQKEEELLSQKEEGSEGEVEKLQSCNLQIAPQALPTVGERISIQISFAKSPIDFYCQRLDTADQLDGIQKALAGIANMATPLTTCEVGTPCAALFPEDQQWYRGVIEEVLPLSKQAVVNFVDFGNSTTSDVSSLKCLKQELLGIPPQAYRCSLTANFELDVAEDELADFVSTLNNQVFSLLVRQVIEDSLIVSLIDEEGMMIGQMYSNATSRVTPYGDDLLEEYGTSQEDNLTSSSAPLATFKWPLKGAIGESIDAYVSLIESPSSFFCQPLHLAAELDEIMTAMETLDYSEALPVHLVEVGVLCAGCFTQDDNWYRAVIEEVQSSDQIRVRYIDYGNEEVVPRNRLAELPPSLLAYKAQLMHCSGFSQEVDIQSEGCLDAFKEIVPEQAQLTINIIKEISNGKYFVKLIDEAGNDIDLAPIREMFNLSSESKDGVTTPGSDVDAEVELITERIEQISLSQTREVDSPLLKGEDPIHKDENEESTIKPIASPPQAIAQSDSNDEGESSDTSSSDGMVSPSAVPFKLTLAIVESLEVEVVAVENPSELYIRRKDCSTEMEMLMDDIKQYTTTSETADTQDYSQYNSEITPQSGEFVLAKFLPDSLWYRAEVHGEYDSDTNSCLLFFIDSGCFQRTQLELIQFCPKSFLALPQQAILCCLSEVPRREAWPSKYKEIMMNFVKEGPLKANVVLPSSEGMRAAIRLVNLSTNKDLSREILNIFQMECDEGGQVDVSLTESEVAEEEQQEEGVPKEESFLEQEQDEDISEVEQNGVSTHKTDHALKESEPNREGVNVEPDGTEGRGLSEEQDTPPDTKLPEEGTPPDTKLPEEGTPPDTKLPEEGTPPDTKLPEEGTPPDTKLPEEGTPPDTKLPEEGTPEDEPQEDKITEESQNNEETEPEQQENDDDEWYDVEEDEGEGGEGDDDDDDVIGYDPSEYSLILPEQINLDVAASFKIKLSYSKDPTNLYLHNSKVSKKIENMMKKLNDFYEDLKPFDFNLTDDPKEDEVVCVASEGEGEEWIWYRARVLSVDYSDEEDPQIELFFVDYGYVDWSGFDDIRRLAVEFAKEPPFAYHCSLGGVTPLSGDDGYGEVCCEYLCSVTEMEEVMTCEVLSVTHEGTYVVHLTTKDGRSLNQALIDGGMALCDENNAITKPLTPPKKSSTLSTPSGTPIKEATIPVVQDSSFEIIQDQEILNTLSDKEDPVAFFSLAPQSESDSVSVKCSKQDSSVIIEEIIDALIDTSISETAIHTVQDDTLLPILSSKPSYSETTPESNIETSQTDIGKSASTLVAVAMHASSELVQETSTELLQSDQSGAQQRVEPSDNPQKLDSNLLQFSSAPSLPTPFQPKPLGRGFRDDTYQLQTRKPTGLGQSLQSASVGSSPRHQQSFSLQSLDPPPPHSSSFNPSDRPFMRHPYPLGAPDLGYSMVPPTQPQVMPIYQGFTPPSTLLPPLQESVGRYPSVTFKPGDRNKFVFVTAADPEHFTCHPFTSTRALQMIVKELEDEVTKYGTGGQVDPNDIAPGLPVLVKYVANNEWCRGEVVSVDELEDDGQPALVSILFVDYGYTEQLRTASLHPMPKRFLALPKQGVKCSLAFVGPCEATEGWSEAAIEAFNKLMSSQDHFHAAVVEVTFDDFLCVQVTVQDSVDVADRLITEELAAPRMTKL